MPGPAKQFDRTAALERGMRLFWRKGYADVSMSELLTEMGIGRQSFYDTFGGKAAVFEESLRRYVEVCQRPALAVLESGPSPHRGVQAFLKAWESAAAARPNDGCFLVNSCDDLPTLAGPSAAIVREAVAHFEKRLVRRIREALDAGEVASRLPAKRLGRILVTLGNGMMLSARDPAAAAPAGLLRQTYLGLVEEAGG